MSLKTSFLAASLALTSLATPVLADSYSEDLGGTQSILNGIYVSVGAGGLLSVEDVTHSSTDHDAENPSLTGEAGIGYRFNKNFRVEASYAFNHFEAESSSLIEDVHIHSKLLTAYYDFDTSSNWSPYVGIGFGSAVTVTDASFDNVDNVGTSQYKLGVTYDTASNTDFFGEVVYQAVDDFNVQRTTEADSIGIWKGQLGLRYSF